ncbi:GTP cyclohydrolase 1 feedback regulatory protein-like [Stylophora pistillata]|uniref:GTP cyclohydrolase 1 feedback regulatory protein n=1 Tax=Stylophora pistillata TaxID=50429 RepID=A0A2B4SE53_STYPI|nr:GTP cyclohydrolase 1 feedback regulatory protein-like [Stylophora pistillata]PFX27656.1 GTP cyclohydrolase 1 feedback regulatory protein [Stylophora pistillata]
MPYILISCQIRLASGPTTCGDEFADKELMKYLEAELVHTFGNNFKEHISTNPPRVVLNRLEERGYRVVAATGVGQTLVWTLYKDDNPEIVDKGKADR